MKRIVGIVLFAFLLAGPAGAAIVLKAKAASFSPSEQAFKDIYGGGPTYGIELEFDIFKGIGFRLGGEYFARRGKLTYTEEETSLRLIPIFAGVYYALGSKAVGFSAGAGVHYVLYHESNVLGTVDKGGLGFAFNGEGYWSFVPSVRLFLFGAYASCIMTPADFKINVGGLSIGGGLGFAF